MSAMPIFQASPALVAALVALLPVVPLVAAEAPAKIIPDIIVTAERRRDAAQQLPLALTAFTGETLSQRNLATPLALAGLVPNMVASNAIGIGGANLYTLRGLGQTSVDAGFSPSVGTFIDDVYLAPAAGTNMLFFDIARLEVLRGSQGTLYGRNTSGGAINVVLARPSDTLAGYGEFSYGAFDRRTARASIDLPLSPVVQLKISGYFQDDDGYVANTVTGETLNDSDAAGIRGAVQLKLTDTLRWNLAAAYLRNDADNLPNALCDPNAPANCNGRFAATGRRANPAFSAVNPLVALGSRIDTQMYTSHIDWVGEGFALASITGFVGSKSRFAIDLSDGRAFPTAAVPFPIPINTAAGRNPVTSTSSSDQFSQELKLTGSILDGRVDYIAGLLYFDTSDVSDRGTSSVRNAVTDNAGYVQVDFNAAERLKLTAGIRYTDEETRFSIVDASPSCALAPVSCLTSGAIPTTRRARFWSPRFAASYRAANDVLVYASAARGFRSGGWDARNRTILPFGAETVWSYEGGVKADGFGGRLRANLAAFWLEAKGVQAPLLADGVPVVQNIPGLRNRGVELEVIAVPIDGINLRAGIGYQKARYDVGDSAAPNSFGARSVPAQRAACMAQLAARQVPLSNGSGASAADCATGIVDANGDVAEPARAPDLSVTIGGSYDWPIPAAGIILTPSVDARYTSAFEAGIANATLFTGAISDANTAYPANPFAGDIITGSRNPAVWQLAAALTMRTDDGNWTLALACENCLDTAFTQSVVGTVGLLNPPRTWQIRARRVF